jgi:hypothetical protein
MFERYGVDYAFAISVESVNSSFRVIAESLSRCNPETKLYWVEGFDGFSNAVHYGTAEKGSGKKLQCKTTLPVFRQVESTVDLHNDTVTAIEGLSYVLGNLFILDPVPSKMRGYSHLSKMLRQDASNIAGVLAALSCDEKKQVEEAITDYAKSLPEKDLKSIYTMTVGQFKQDAMLICEEGWEGAHTSVVDASGMSDGTLRYLAIVAALLTRPKHSLFIIEEADNGLHSSRAGHLLDMLKTLGKKREIDVLVTTHNPALLDAAGHRMIPFIFAVHRDRNSGSSLITPIDSLDSLPKLMASGSIGDLSRNRSIENALGMEVS